MGGGAFTYVHFVIWETYSVYWYSIDLWLIGGGGALVYVHSAICDLHGVVVFHRSMVDLGGLCLFCYMLN